LSETANSFPAEPGNAIEAGVYPILSSSQFVIISYDQGIAQLTEPSRRPLPI